MTAAPAGDVEPREAIDAGRTALGIELGSTRVKAALIGPSRLPVATGGHAWSNELVDGLWTYDLDDVISGLQSCYAHLRSDVSAKYGAELTQVGSLGVSAMMHGYLAFDANDKLLVPFRTWRNTNTDEASRRLSGLFGQNIPHRWSIAHLYQAMLDDEEHLDRLSHITTLAGYVHTRLTGRRVLGVGDASGMFPIDVRTGTYDQGLVDRFDTLAAEKGYHWRLSELLPDVLRAGEEAGSLTPAGGSLLDPGGILTVGVPMCPPEGDAGTGMVATNSVTPGTGNVSAGTSIFAMVVLDGPLAASHPEIDLVNTPSGELVGMVHCNNGTSELDAWISVFGEFAAAAGAELDGDRLFELMYAAGLSGDPDAGGLLAFNFVSGEPVVGVESGMPLLTRSPDSRFSLANLMRAQLYATVGALRIGMDVLRNEGVEPSHLFAHGGFFKTRDVGQRVLAAALDTPVSVGELAGEGGAWGMALLAAYAALPQGELTLSDFLANDVFSHDTSRTVKPRPDEVEGFAAFMDRYRAGLPVERGLADALAPNE